MRDLIAQVFCNCTFASVWVLSMGVPDLQKATAHPESWASRKATGNGQFAVTQYSSPPVSYPGRQGFRGYYPVSVEKVLRFSRLRDTLAGKFLSENNLAVDSSQQKA